MLPLYNYFYFYEQLFPFLPQSQLVHSCSCSFPLACISSVVIMSHGWSHHYVALHCDQADRKCFNLCLRLNRNLRVGWRTYLPPSFHTFFFRRRRLWWRRRKSRCQGCCNVIAPPHTSKLGCVPRNLMMLHDPSCFLPFSGNSQLKHTMGW